MSSVVTLVVAQVVAAVAMEVALVVFHSLDKVAEVVVDAVADLHVFRTRASVHQIASFKTTIAFLNHPTLSYPYSLAASAVVTHNVQPLVLNVSKTNANVDQGGTSRALDVSAGVS